MGAKASQIIMQLLYLCIKPETSEMQQKCFHAIVKVKNFQRELRQGCYMQLESLLAVLKNRYFRPCKSGLHKCAHM